MKYTGITGLLAVVTAVTGAAIPNVQLSQATDAEISKLQKDLSQVQKALDQATQKRGLVDGLTNEIPGVGPAASSVTSGLESATSSIPGVGNVVGAVVKRGVVDGLTSEIPGVGPAASSVTSELESATSPIPGVGNLVGAVVKRDGPVDGALGAAGGAVNTAGGATTYALGTVGDALTKREGAVTGQAGNLVSLLDEGVKEVPLLGGPLSGVTGAVGGVVKGITQASPIKRDGAVTGEASDLLNTVGQTAGEAPVLGGPLSDATGAVGGVVKGVTQASPIKREDPVSQLAGSLLPQLESLNVLPQSVNLQQLTGLLGELNAQGLIGNLEQVLGGLLNGGLLSGLGGLLKRDDQISQLATKLLPGLLQKNILSNVGVDQLTTLLSALNVNGLLTNVQSVLGGLL